MSQYRILALDGNGYYYSVVLGEEAFKNEDHKFDLQSPPTIAQYPIVAGKPMEYIPFVFIGPDSLSASPAIPPLIEMAEKDVAIYRGEADYRNTLFLQGQDTLTATGVKLSQKVNTGCGAVLSTKEEKANFKYIGVSSDGLPEQRAALQELKRTTVGMGIDLIEDRYDAESGRALEIRSGLKGASLRTIAKTGAMGLQKALSYAADMVGADPTAVKVAPNDDFSTANAAAQDIMNLWAAKLDGAPVSAETWHDYLRDNGFTTRSYEEEIKMVQAEPKPEPIAARQTSMTRSNDE